MDWRMRLRNSVPIVPFSEPGGHWTQQKLHEALEGHFYNRRLIAVSNREPYIHRFSGHRVECIQPASGLASALDPIMRATGGTWIAHGSGDADRFTVDPFQHVAVPEGDPRYTLRRVWLDPETERRYYYGLANEGLWPLCHIAFQRPQFRAEDWESYREANYAFAEAVLEEAAGKPAVVFIQDYHFALLPRILKKRNPSLTVAQFWHIPWPNREVFRAFPWGEELLDGLLGNDLLGFHLQYHCANFLDTVDRGVEAMVDVEYCSIRRGGTVTLVRPFPISIDFEAHNKEAQSSAVDTRMEVWRRELRLNTEHLGIGIDRADYTKGIPDRLRAIDRLLELFPDWRGKFVFLQVAVPSRTRIAAYGDLNSEIERISAEINARWSAGDWEPIRLWPRHLPQPDLMALHRLAAFCLVSSLHDGMNLVAKEFVASRADEDGCLILSEFTGAARELTEAIPVNPFSADEMAEAIDRALTMPAAERRRRMQALRATVREQNVYAWGANLMRVLLQCESGGRGAMTRERARVSAV
jgi:alpha,alpha-trehalose-phosphate synthase [UDP-forming]